MHALPALNAQGASLQNRALVICLAASLLLHAALLFLLPGMREGGQSASATQILTATFAPRTSQPAPAPVKEVAPQRPQPPKPEPQPQRPPPKVEAPRPVLTAPATAPAPVIPQPPPPPVAAVPESPPVAPAPPPAVASAPRPAEPAAPLSTAPPRPPAEAADAGSLAQYRLALITSARRYKRYPAQAMEKGWQGKVEVRLEIGANGMIRTASVKSSSGYDILDKQALDMITKGKTLVPIPAALRGKEFVVDVPVIFDLQAG
jgi:protein TonB